MSTPRDHIGTENVASDAHDPTVGEAQDTRRLFVQRVELHSTLDSEPRSEDLKYRPIRQMDHERKPMSRISNLVSAI
jgi:hypothetical protein